MGKHHPVSALATVGIAGKQPAAMRIDLSNNVHQVGVSPLAEDQLPVTGERQTARTLRLVVQLDHQELDRRIHGDVGVHFRCNPGLKVLKHAVAEAVPADVARAAMRRQRRRRPEGAGFLIANVDRFAAAVRKRVVVPGGEAEFMGVFHPGIGAAALADHGADVLAGDHVGPGHWRSLAGLKGDHVFVAIGCEATQTIAENTLARRQWINRFGARLLRGLQQIRYTFR